MAEPAPLGVVVVSGVRHAASYLPVLGARGDVAVRAVCEERDADERARTAGRALADGAAVPYTEDVGAALGRPDVDVALVCSEPTRHARLALAALAAGRHVLVDKPLATSVDDATAVLAAARSAPGALTVVNRLLTPPVRRARAAIEAGHVGLPRHLDVELLADGAHFSTSVERPDLVADPRLSGGGEVRNFFVYPLDLVRHLTGCEVVSVYAETGSLFFDAHRRYGVEDVAVVSMLLERDVTATVTVGRVPRAPSSGPNSSTLRLIGSHGRLTFDEDAPALTLWRDRGAVARPIAPATAADPIAAVVDDLVAAIRAGRPPAYTAEDAWAAVAATDAVYRSAATAASAAVAPLPRA